MTTRSSVSRTSLCGGLPRGSNAPRNRRPRGTFFFLSRERERKRDHGRRSRDLKTPLSDPRYATGGVRGRSHGGGRRKRSTRIRAWIDERNDLAAYRAHSSLRVRRESVRRTRSGRVAERSRGPRVE